MLLGVSHAEEHMLLGQAAVGSSRCYRLFKGCTVVGNCRLQVSFVVAVFPVEVTFKNAIHICVASMNSLIFITAFLVARHPINFCLNCQARLITSSRFAFMYDAPF